MHWLIQISPRECPVYKRHFLDDLSSWYFWQWCQIYKKYKFLSVTQNMCVNEWERGGKGGEKRRERGGAFNRQLRAGENIWRWHLVGEKRTLVIFCPQPPPFLLHHELSSVISHVFTMLNLCMVLQSWWVHVFFSSIVPWGNKVFLPLQILYCDNLQSIKRHLCFQKQ